MPAISATQRLLKELKELKSTNAGVECRYAEGESNILHLIGTIHGSEGTPYAGTRSCFFFVMRKPWPLHLRKH
jgi:ubiquitin-protein ligase